MQLQVIVCLNKKIPYRCWDGNIPEIIIHHISWQISVSLFGDFLSVKTFVSPLSSLLSSREPCSWLFTPRKKSEEMIKFLGDGNILLSVQMFSYSVS